MPQAKKEGPKAQQDETPRERFTRLAELRTGRALEAIVSLRALANKDRYEYADADIAKITEAITGELATTTRALADGKVPAAVTFHL